MNITSSRWKLAENPFKQIFSQCFSSERYPKEGLPEAMVLLDNFVLLVANLKHLELGQVEVICHVVECSITTWKAMYLQVESGHEDDLSNISSEISSVFERLSSSVANFVEWKPRYRWENKLQVNIYEELCISFQGKKNMGRHQLLSMRKFLNVGFNLIPPFLILKMYAL